jgi:hypothetical protein
MSTGRVVAWVLAAASAIVLAWAVAGRKDTVAPVAARSVNALRVRELPGPARKDPPPSDPARQQAVAKALAGRTRPLHPVVAPLDGRLTKQEGTYFYSSTPYGATLSPEGAEFGVAAPVERIGAPLIRFTFKECRVGERVWARGGSVAPNVREERREVYYRRGAIEERYTLRDDEVEQDFVIDALPNGRGEIVVTCAVDTNLEVPADGTTGESLRFACGSETGFTLARAVAIDASGARLPLDLGWSGGQVNLRVPAEWVAGARLPIVVDPVLQPGIKVGNGTTFDDFAPLGTNQWICAQSFMNGASFGNGQIQAVLRSANGLQLPVSVIDVSAGPEDDVESSICHAPTANRYLVIWTRRVSGTEMSIMGRVLTNTGAVLSPIFTIGNFPNNDEKPVVATNGSLWYVVWENTSTFTIRGRIVNADGTLGPAADPETVEFGSYPQVTWGPGGFLVLWRKGGVSPPPLRARLMSAAGVFSGPAVTLEPNVNEQFAATSNATRYLLTFAPGRARFYDAALNAIGSTIVISNLERPQMPPGYVGTGKYPKPVWVSSLNQWYVAAAEEIWQPTDGGTWIYGGDIVVGHLLSDAGLVGPADELTDGSYQVNGLRLTLHPGLNQIGAAVKTSWETVFRQVGFGGMSAVTGLTATAGNQQVALAWTATPGAQSYTVRRATVPAGPFNSVAANLTSAAYTDTGLLNFTTYYYQVTAIVDARESLSASASATPSNQALFVVGATPLSAADAAVQTRLQALGYIVVVRTGPASTTADATAKALVVISSTITPADVNTKYRNVSVPVLCWENAIFDDMNMTGTISGTNFGTTPSTTQIAISNPSHPMAAGLSGTVSVNTTATALSWGAPAASAAVVATQIGTPGRAVIFGYDTAATMVGLAAPARRVGFFLGNATAATLTANGSALLNAAVQWATGTTPPSGLLAARIAVSPEPATVSLNGIVDYATLIEAVAAARSGDTIRLGPGTFALGAEGLRLPSGVTLEGSGACRTILRAETGGTAVSLAVGGRSAIRDLVITGGALGIDVGDADVQLRNVVVAGVDGDGVTSGVDAVVEGVFLTVVSNRGRGLALLSAQVSIRSSLIGRNDGAGIRAPAGARVTYTGIFDNGQPSSGGVSLEGGENIFQSVLFRDPAALDYRELPYSASIDRADPTDGFHQEPNPNGRRANQGAFGNTSDAEPSRGR